LILFGEVPKSDPVLLAEESEKVKEKLENVLGAVERLTGALKGDSSEVLADLVESELADMEKAIEEAALKIEVINNTNCVWLS